MKSEPKQIENSQLAWSVLSSRRQSGLMKMLIFFRDRVAFFRVKALHYKSKAERLQEEVEGLRAQLLDVNINRSRLQVGQSRFYRSRKGR